MSIITMTFTSQTSADGLDSLGLTPVIFSGQMYFRRKRQRISARQVFTRLVRTRNIVFIWCLILQIPRRWQKGSRLREGKFGSAGYYTVAFDTPVTVKERERFAVVVELTTPDSVHPLAIEYAADETTENVDLSDGEARHQRTGKFVGKCGERTEL